MGVFSNLFRGKKLSDTLSFNNSDVKNLGTAGSGEIDQGIAGLNTQAGTYQDLIDKGGITPELQRQFDVARGALSDQYVRGGRSLNAALAARRQQLGGALTPGAVAEMEKQAGATRDENYFDASNNLAMDKANLTYASTKDLFSRIEDIKKTITTTGLTREQQALMARLQLAGLSMQRKQMAINGVLGVANIAKGMGGGAGAPAGG